MSAADQERYDFVTIARELESAAPSDIIAWAMQEFGTNTTYACSFEDVALLRMLLDAQPETEVIFLDTGGHFPETYDFVARLERDWNINLVRTAPGEDAVAYPCGTDGCCQKRKVEPLQRAVSGKRAWFTGVKRVDSPTRADMPVVSWDDKFGLVKVNPLATWTDDDVAYFLGENGLPEHPLWAQGYTSIGCAAVTIKPLPGSDRRSGRWAGSDKQECGLHE
jgi:phosphoadenosine phosphosulfate reductase